MTNSFSGIIVSSRIRLARNVRNCNFRATIKEDAANQIVNAIAKQVDRYCQTVKCPPLRLFRMRDLAESARAELVERYVISNDLMQNVRTGAVLTNKDESISLMINEEDHIRAQSLLAGNNLKRAYQALVPIDGWLDKTIGFAKTNGYGYLTACPTNLGTGLRASAMMFLPAHAKNGQIGGLSSAAKEMGLTVRGAFGEGSDSDSCLYQVSNQITLGKSEEQIIDSVHSFVMEIACNEEFYAKQYYEEREIELEDEVLRAYGILTNCRRLEYGEFSKLLATLKFGAMQGIIKIKDVTDLDFLLVNARTNTLMNSLIASNEAVNKENLSIFRATYVRENLSKTCSVKK